jgi:hypothetical protein
MNARILVHSEREVILLDALNFSNHFRAIRPRYQPPGNSNTEQPGEIPASGLSSLFLLVSVKSKSWRAPPPPPSPSSLKLPNWRHCRVKGRIRKDLFQIRPLKFCRIRISSGSDPEKYENDVKKDCIQTYMYKYKYKQILIKKVINCFTLFFSF